MNTDGSKKPISGASSRWDDSRVAVPATNNYPVPFGLQFGNMHANGQNATQSPPVIVASSAEQGPSGGTHGVNGNVTVENSQASASKAREPLPFTTDMSEVEIQTSGSRYLNLQGPMKSNDGITKNSIIECLWGDKLLQQKIAANLPPGYFTCWVEFDDIRDAIKAFPQLHTVGQDVHVQFTGHGPYAAAMGNPPHTAVSRSSSKFDAQVMFEVKFVGKYMDVIAKNEIDKQVLAIAERFGSVRVFKEDTPFSSPAWQFRAEYWAISSAKAAIQKMPIERSYMYKDWAIFARNIMDLSASVSAFPQFNNGAVGIQSSGSGRTTWTVDHLGNSIVHQPTTRVPKVPTDDFADVGPVEPYRTGRYGSVPSASTSGAFEMATVGPRSNSFAGPSTSMSVIPRNPRVSKRVHNEELTRIYPERVSAGQDVRTTVMIRNLPNEWTVHDMKFRLDQDIWGRYDFSYLRIDFSRNTNIGYCFVNVLDVKDVLTLYWSWTDRYFGTNKYGESRICSVSYASSQGVESGIDRFRNSSVIDEFPDFRPKLWWTVETAPTLDKVGTERPFPECNNRFKKQRSQDNAAHLGLYLPRSRFNHGNRTHRSQYDRGTPSQIQEEAMYNLVSSNHRHIAPVNGYPFHPLPPALFGTVPGAYPRTPNPTNFNASVGAIGGPNDWAQNFPIGAHAPLAFQGYDGFPGYQSAPNNANGRNGHAGR